jgi:predicted exporter
VAGRAFLTAFAFCRRHRGRLVLGLGALLAAAVSCIYLLPFDNSLEPMLPAGSRARAMLRYLDEAGMADKIAVSIECVGETGEEEECGARLRETVARISGRVALPWLSGIATPLDAPDPSRLSLLDLVPATFDEQRARSLRELLTPEGARALLRRQFVQAVGPQGMFMGSRIRRDPLGLEADLAGRAFKASAALGFDLRLENGLLRSLDGRRALLVLETPVPMTDSAGAKGLVSHLDGVMGDLPPDVRADYVCGHTHTVSNEQLLKRDIAITGLVETTAFLVLVLLCFRDPRGALLILAIPSLAALLALPLTFLVTGRLAFLVVGLGTVIAGISIDYGIHSYVAARHGHDPAQSVRAVAGPVASGFLTTCGLFVGFLVSRSPGYRQLGWFAVFSLCGALALALLVLPQFAGRGLPLAPPVPPLPPLGRRRPQHLLIVAAWLVAVAGALVAARGVGFDGDVKRLDGVSPEIRATEERFDQVWRKGAKGQALLAVTSSGLEGALATNDRIYERCRLAGCDDWLVSIAPLWPGWETRLANQERWRAFWSDETRELLRERLVKEGLALGFAKGAFDPFFEWIASGSVLPEPSVHPVLKPLWQRLVRRRGEQVHVVSYFPDDAEHLRAVEAASAGLEEAHVVSPRAIEGALSDTFSDEIVRLTSVALGCILLVTLLLVRRPGLVLIVVIPPVSAVAGLFVAMNAFSLSINVANLMAGIVVFGLSMDYSYVMMHGVLHQETGTSRLVVHVSAITTIIGTAVLLLAHHPALFSIGLTLTIGTLCGYLGAIAIVPAALRLWLARG